MDVSHKDAGMYEFVVKADNEMKPITITQYSLPIPVRSQVHILEKNETVFISRNRWKEFTE